jgi:hypothetical protein
MNMSLKLSVAMIAAACACALALPGFAARDDGIFALDVEGEALVNYQAEPLHNPKGGARFKGSNFIHPLKTPSGFVLTEIQPGDHLHHFGLWWPWKYVARDGRRVLFWELQHGEGIIEARGAEKTDDGFRAESVYLDRKAPGGPQEWIREKLSAEVSALRDDPARGYFLDLEIAHEVVGEDPLEIVKYRYSGFALRGTPHWNRDNSRVLTSAGKDYSQSNFSRARWVLVQGENDAGGNSGVLIMSHPANRNHPEHLRTWDPGTHRGAIFINFNPVQDQSFTILSDGIEIRRYRLFVFDGEIDAAAAEALWKSYAGK